LTTVYEYRLYLDAFTVHDTVTSAPALQRLSPVGGSGISIATDALAVTLGMYVAE
jgi:hypothetical protein